MNMNPRHSLKVYPRLDQGYKVKKSLNFDLMKSNLFVSRGEPEMAKLWRWIAYALIGLITGCIAFLMALAEDEAVKLRNYITDEIIDSYRNNQTTYFYNVTDNTNHTRVFRVLP